MDDEEEDDQPFFDAQDSLNSSNLSVSANVSLPQINVAVLEQPPSAKGLHQLPHETKPTDLTPNKPVADAPGEVLLVKNLDTGQMVPLHELEAQLPRHVDPITRNIMQRTLSTEAAESSTLTDSDDDIEKAPSSFLDVAQPPNDKSTQSANNQKSKSTWLKMFSRHKSEADLNGGTLAPSSSSISSTTSSSAPSPITATPTPLTPPPPSISSIFDGEDSDPIIHKYIKTTLHQKARREFDRLVRVQDLEAHQGAIWTIAFSFDGRYLASAGQDAAIRIWQLISEDSAPVTTAAGANPIPVKSVPTPFLMSFTKDQLDSVKTHRKSKSLEQMAPPVFSSLPFRTYLGHEADISHLAWSKSNFILSASMDKTVRLWHVTREECLCIFQHTDVVSSVAFHPKDDRVFVSGALDSKLRLWSIPEKRVVSYNELPENSLITAVAFAAKGEQVLAGTYLGTCFLYETEGLKYDTQIFVKSSRGRNKGKKITGIEITPGLEHVLISSNDSRLRAYHLNDKSLFCKYRGHVNQNSQIRPAYSDDGRYIISGSEDHRVYIWSATQTAPSADSFSVFSSFRRDLNESFESFEVLMSGTITAAIFAPSKLKQRLEEKELRAASALKGLSHGHVIVCADSTGTLRIFENERPLEDPTSQSVPESLFAPTEKHPSGTTLEKRHSRTSSLSSRFPLFKSSDDKQSKGRANTCISCGGVRLTAFQMDKDHYQACLECNVSWRV